VGCVNRAVVDDFGGEPPVHPQREAVAHARQVVLVPLLQLEPGLGVTRRAARPASLLDAPYGPATNSTAGDQWLHRPVASLTRVRAR